MGVSATPYLPVFCEINRKVSSQLVSFLFHADNCQGSANCRGLVILLSSSILPDLSELPVCFLRLAPARRLAVEPRTTRRSSVAELVQIGRMACAMNRLCVYNDESRSHPPSAANP